MKEVKIHRYLSSLITQDGKNKQELKSRTKQIKRALLLKWMRV